MKKLGLAIGYEVENYGGVLQAYATQKAVEKMGIDYEVINLSGISKILDKRKLSYYAKKVFDKDVIKDKGGYIHKKIVGKLNPKLEKNLALRSRAFKSYRENNFVLSRECCDFRQLREMSTRYDSVLVGSDQLWLPSNIEADFYTLNFVPSYVNKVAYATSFGMSSLPQRQKELAKDFLNRIEYLSARELSGHILIKELTGRNVPIVCDPVMLLNTTEWEHICGREEPGKEKYIFCYFLGKNMKAREFAKNLREITGYKIVALNHCDIYVKADDEMSDYSPYDFNPVKFVEYIKNAEYICTDSFHASTFSLMFKKMFFAFKRFTSNTTQSTNNRLDSLFKIAGAGSRMFTGNEDVKEALKTEIDYEKVSYNLSKIKESSYRYLRESLLEEFE